MLDKALETNTTQYLNFDKKKRLVEIEKKLKNELILLDSEINHLLLERSEILLELKEDWKTAKEHNGKFY